MEFIRIKDKMFLTDGNRRILVDMIFVNSSPKKNIRQANNWIVEANVLLQKEDAKFGVIHSFDDNRKILVSKKSNEWEIYIPDWRKKRIGWYNG